MIIGLCYYENGDKYDGDWKNGKREGRGNQSFAVGTKYEGEWKNDKMNGRGKIFTILGLCVYSNGNKYEGDWKNDQMEGHGN